MRPQKFIRRLLELNVPRPRELQSNALSCLLYLSGDDAGKSWMMTRQKIWIRSLTRGAKLSKGQVRFCAFIKTSTSLNYTHNPSKRKSRQSFPIVQIWHNSHIVDLFKLQIDLISIQRKRPTFLWKPRRLFPQPTGIFSPEEKDHHKVQGDDRDYHQKVQGDDHHNEEVHHH